ncbi:hypothetical protein CROQUDRAFT_102254 [Cronartium quercuum f. sp. fusiforme G11]|uniref:Uncharacterized protein n=1 Tax=Cronartium quercuum f. sp. fusiforme G11 TaxID=708437 RepID=A0A9P6N5P4_9BASI|nr:hypothetical protein CROQUDRAFT_102254 [Cronartium quercuum f. sp. fusiforme G11]
MRLIEYFNQIKDLACEACVYLECILVRAYNLSEVPCKLRCRWVDGNEGFFVICNLAQVILSHHRVNPTVLRPCFGTGSPRILTANGLFYRIGVHRDGLKPGGQPTDVFRCLFGSHGDVGHTRCADSVFKPKAGPGCGQPGRFRGPHRVPLNAMKAGIKDGMGS